MQEQEAPQPNPGEIEVVEGLNPELQKLPTKKIAICGTCPSRGLAPTGDLSWEIWTIGPGGKNVHRWERLFEIHGTKSWPEGFRQYLEELKAEKPPKVIYTEDAMPDWPANVVYPKLQMFEKYGRMWFSSTISYAIAMAIEENVTDLGVYGIDLESGEEYQSQKAGAKFFLTLARLAGINIHMPKGCGLMVDPNPYPDSFETALAMAIEAKLDYLKAKSGELTAEHGRISAEINHINGEIGAFEYMRTRFVIHGEDPGRRAPNQGAKMSLDTKVDLLMDMMRANIGHEK